MKTFAKMGGGHPRQGWGRGGNKDIVRGRNVSYKKLSRGAGQLRERGGARLRKGD